MTSKFYDEIDKLTDSMVSLLNNYSKSQILQEYFFELLNSLFYGNLILNFFENLTKENLKEFRIELNEVNKLNEDFQSIYTKADLVVKDTFNSKKVTEKDYNTFKEKIQNHHSKFKKIIFELEKEVNIKKAKSYLSAKRKKIGKCGKSNPNLDTTILTSAIETCVIKENRFPIDPESSMLSEIISIDLIKQFAKTVVPILKKDTKRMLTEQRNYQAGFEKRLYRRWKKPIDLLESLIRISTEAVQDKNKRQSKKTKNKNKYKKSALIQIHARGLQIATEILTLVKTGFADGANARWRSLLELSVISFFLRDNDDEISLRYLEFDIIKKFKEANDFQRYHKLLGEKPVEKKQFELFQKEINRLIKKYGKEYVKSEYGWIPSKVIKKPSFRKLSERAKLEKFYPYYNFSSNAIHGGPRGFYRLGLMQKYQDTLVVGSTNYGLADPIQNTAIMLSQITANLLTLDPDFESLIITYVIFSYIDRIGKSAVKIQKNLEKETLEMGDEPLRGFFIR